MDNTGSEEVFEEQINIDESKIPIIAGSSGFNTDLYAGRKVKIASHKIMKETDFYVDDAGIRTNIKNPNSKEKCFKVYLYSEPLRELKLREGEDPKNSDSYMFGEKLVEIQREDGTVKNVVIRGRLNMQKDKLGNPEISKYPKCKLWAAMKKLGATSLTEIDGKFVMLALEPSTVEGDERKYLRLAL